jgi:hypothetical protein
MNDPRYKAILQRVQDISTGAFHSGTPGVNQKIGFANAIKFAFKLRGTPYVDPTLPVSIDKIAEFVFRDLYPGQWDDIVASKVDPKRRWFFITTCAIVPLNKIPTSMPDKAITEFVHILEDIPAVSSKHNVPTYLLGYAGTEDEFLEFVATQVSRGVDTATSNLGENNPVLDSLFETGSYSPQTIALMSDNWIKRAREGFDKARLEQQKVKKEEVEAEGENPDSAKQHFRRSLLVRAFLEGKASAKVVERINKETKLPVKVAEVWFWGEEMFQCEYTEDGPMIPDHLFIKLEKVLGIVK